MRRVLLIMIVLGFFTNACHRGIEFEPDWLGNPLAGTWELDTARSVFRSESRVQSQTRTYASIDGGERFVLDGRLRDGRHVHAEYRAKVDGRDYLLTGLAEVNAVSIHQGTGVTWGDVIEKLNRREILRERREVTHDLQTLTVTITRARAPIPAGFES
jgi:hypothetical protein